MATREEEVAKFRQGSDSMGLKAACLFSPRKSISLAPLKPWDSLEKVILWQLWCSEVELL